METRTRFVFLMHPKEYKHEKAATGRLTHLCLRRSDRKYQKEKCLPPHGTKHMRSYLAGRKVS